MYVNGGIKIIILFAFISLSALFLLLSSLSSRPFLSTRLMHLQESSKDISPFAHASCERPLRVYMYEIPRKFNFGMLKKSDPNQNLPWTSKRIPPWPQRSGLKKQHNVEYWMTLYLLKEQEERMESKAAVRVMDPAEADTFFMPFFSSLSFNVHGTNMKDPETEKDRILQVEVVDMLKNSPWWKRSGGRDHVLVIHHPNAFRFLRDEVNASIFVVSDFGRYSQNVSRLSKDVVAPYAHVVDAFENDNVVNPFESRTILLFFRGRMKRKDEGFIRKQLASLLQNYPNVMFEDSIATAEGLEKATKGMRLSRFCLHPAGDTPSSCRLFDSIVSHCVPVIVSDKIELPFEDELDYHEFCLFVSVDEALRPGYLINYLEHFREEHWLNMWNRLKQVAHHFEYQFPAKKDDATNMIWKQIQHKVPAIKLSIHRSKRLKIPDWWQI